MTANNENITSNMSQTEKVADDVRLSLTNSPSRVSIITNPRLDGQNELLGVVYGIGMNVNNVIGSGIVTSPGSIWKAIKSPGIVLLLWLIGGIVSMAGSLSYVELGVIHKISGGETKYLQTAYPNPKLMMSYLFSFMFIFAIRPGILSAILQSAAQYFWFTIKGYRYSNDINEITNGWHLPFSPFWFIKLTAVAILFIITAYHIISNKWANYINQTLAAIKLTTYSIIAISGVYRLCTDPENRVNWQQPLGGNADVTSYSTSILLIMFSYDGWNNLNYSLDEFRKPEKKLIFSNSISVGIVTVVYLLVNIAFISVVPEDEILNNKLDETIAATFFRKLFNGSDVAVRIFTALIVLSVMGTAAATVWSGSRVIVAAARSNFFPVYSQELRTWHNYLDTPINALIFQFIWCTFIIFFVGSSFNISSFTLLATFSMYSYWIFYFATGVGLLVIRFRKRRQTKRGYDYGHPADKKLFKVPLTVAGIFILAGLFILTFSFVVDDSCPKELNPKDCSEYSKQARIQQMAPIFISYAFFFFAIIFWYFLYYWWDTFKDEKQKRLLEEETKRRMLEMANEETAHEEADEIDISEFSAGPSNLDSKNQSLHSLHLSQNQSLNPSIRAQSPTSISQVQSLNPSVRRAQSPTSVNQTQSLNPSIRAQTPTSVDQTQSLNPSIRAQSPTSVDQTQSLNPSIRAQSPISVNQTQSLNPSIRAQSPISVNQNQPLNPSIRAQSPASLSQTQSIRTQSITSSIRAQSPTSRSQNQSFNPNIRTQSPTSRSQNQSFNPNIRTQSPTSRSQYSNSRTQSLINQSALNRTSTSRNQSLKSSDLNED